MKLERKEPPPGEGARGDRPLPGERRRARWGEFRHAYPGIVATMFVAMLGFLAIDVWLLAKQRRYAAEVRRLRGGMTDVEKERADMLLASDENRLRVMIALVRRQALGDRELHLSVVVDSGIMHLEREGARLRDMRIDVGPEKTVGIGADTVRMAVPRGTRTVERVLAADASWEVPSWVFADRGLAVPDARMLKGSLGPVAIILDGGSVIYSPPTSGPLADSAYVLPGGVRASAQDLRAIAPNLKPGMKVYFY